MIDIVDIRSTIVSGRLTNAELDSILTAATFARSQLARQNTGKFVKGSTVKFTSNRNGQRYDGVVEKVSIKNVIVRITAGPVTGTAFKVPANMLEKA